MRQTLAIVVLVAFATSAAGVTIHRSFRGGFPSAVSEARRDAAEKGALTGGTYVAPRTKVAAFKKLAGKVTRVDDGNTLLVANAAGRHKIRLVKIAAPKRDQPYGEESAKFLNDLVCGKEVEVHYEGKDEHGNILGIAYLKHAKGMVDVNLTMLKNGCARYDSYYKNHTSVYSEAENDARKFRRGLWAANAQNASRCRQPGP